MTTLWKVAVDTDDIEVVREIARFWDLSDEVVVIDAETQLYLMEIPKGMAVEVEAKGWSDREVIIDDVPYTAFVEKTLTEV